MRVERGEKRRDNSPFHHSYFFFSTFVLIQEGRGVRQIDKRAVMWFRVAAEQKSAPAQFSLAVMYENGRGVDHDPAQAAKW